jgi:uncharacterized membrane protein
MTISLAASLNQDGLIIATSALCAALLGRPTETAHDQPNRWGYGTAAILLTCIIVTKPPYFPLAAMLVLPIPQNLTGRKIWASFIFRVGVALCVAMAAFIWAAYLTYTISTPISREAYEAGPLWPGTRPALFRTTDPMAQLKVLLAEPSRLVTLPLDFLFHDNWWQQLVLEAIGILGWLNLMLPKSCYVIWKLATAAALFADGITGSEASLRYNRLNIVMLLLAGSFYVWAVVLSQYIIWTNVGFSRIEGPQGRYFLPIIALIAMAMPVRLTNGQVIWWSALLRCIPFGAAGLNLFFVPRLILSVFVDG